MKELQKILSQEIEKKHLTNREIVVLYLRYILKEEGMTLEEVGEILSVTRERIRQIEAKAFEKLEESYPQIKDLTK